jgi:hypothetical protein
MRTVDIGKQSGGLRLINKGVSPGERVITEGLQKVHDGMEVNPHVVVAEPASQATAGSADGAPAPPPVTTPGSQS